MQVMRKIEGAILGIVVADIAIIIFWAANWWGVYSNYTFSALPWMPKILLICFFSIAIIQLMLTVILWVLRKRNDVQKA